MDYGIAYEDRNGNEHHRGQYGTFPSERKAKEKAKELNKAMAIKTNGKFVVVEL